MSHDLFTDVVAPTVRVRSSSRYTLLVSVVAHALIVAAVIIVPLLASGVLPTPASGPISFMPAMPTPPPPSAPPAPSAVKRDIPNPNAAPIDSPTGIKDELPPQPLGEAVEGGLEGLGSTTTGVGADAIGVGIPTPPPPAPAPPPTQPVRVGGAIREPVKVRNVPPVYPDIAIRAKISGMVIIEAIIGTDGNVREARVLRGVPLLNQAALQAVRQWTYTPTTLNNVPVPVIMTVTVNFQLQ